MKRFFGQGIKVTYQNKICLVGNDKLLKAHQIDFEMPHIKHTVIHVAYDKKYIGYIVLEDEVKISAKETITTLKQLNKSVSMITGDHKFIALDIAKKLGIDNVHYEQLPHEKKRSN